MKRSFLSYVGRTVKWLAIVLVLLYSVVVSRVYLFGVGPAAGWDFWYNGRGYRFGDRLEQHIGKLDYKILEDGDCEAYTSRADGRADILVVGLGAHYGSVLFCKDTLRALAVVGDREFIRKVGERTIRITSVDAEAGRLDCLVEYNKKWYNVTIQHNGEEELYTVIFGKFDITTLLPSQR